MLCVRGTTIMVHAITPDREQVYWQDFVPHQLIEGVRADKAVRVVHWIVEEMQRRILEARPALTVADLRWTSLGVSERDLDAEV